MTVQKDIRWRFQRQVLQSALFKKGCWSVGELFVREFAHCAEKWLGIETVRKDQ
ncbi:hypothetical protein SAMN04488073_3117 [Marinobacter gudaonensis]|uniref:Uncharacterized protein n=1 Tax=Marinobacter gudaonensis TaxID=375760 RepID=A0A1I6HV29_9GAMM|nr:hypothetical protein SAMN04488073_3117 [Marinobacter gudaonensis]